MRAATRWKDYELIDAADGERLERWGDILLIRPDPQILWKTPRRSPLWNKAHARYHRSHTGGGQWERLKPLPDVWEIGYGSLRFRLKPMGFKHTGLFPEQAVNWDAMSAWIREAGRPIRVLNLFGYTGGATLACTAAGAHVTHVDASKGMVAWGRENAAASGLADRPMRWLVDDCGKFVQREQRRGNTYDAILMDIRMPVMDGLEAARNIRLFDKSDAQTIPIIAMTANAFDEDVEKSHAAGMNAHLAKPIDPEKLFAVLQEFI